MDTNHSEAETVEMAKYLEGEERAVRRPVEVARAARRALERGVTLVEVLIVVAIMALIAGSATILVFPRLKEARVKTAYQETREIKKAAELYLNLSTSGDACPTIQDLIQAKYLEAGKTDDPWGMAYKISCDGADVHVVSSGADKKEGSPDDLRDDMKQSDVDKAAKL
jgi:general secretion pathway protein G